MKLTTLPKTLFFTSRPISWINTAFPFAAAYLVSGGTNLAVLVVGSLFFLVAYNLLMYGVNDVFDYESDLRNPRKGSIEGALSDTSYHHAILTASLLVPLPFVAWLSLQGSVSANVWLAILLFFVVAYSLKGLRFKEIPFLDSITSSLHFVGPLIYGLLLTDAALLHYWPFIAAFFLWGMASHAFGAVQDIVPDRAGNLASIATVLGASATMKFVVLCYVGAVGLLIYAGGLALIVAACGLLYIAMAWPYVSLSDKESGRANRGWRQFIWLNLITGAVVTNVLIYIALTAT
ncbi:prenyltransferase [Candidatus Saccharibacteria bacterium]|nr:prenyltransferase [Candidatus Saccharibacteria bacterium]